MEAILIGVGLYLCFSVIVVGAVLAFPARPKVLARHWSGVLPGDTVVAHGEERQVVEIDFEHDAIKVDRPFDWGPLQGEWVAVRHDTRGVPPVGVH
jgi:hypothetical protein